MRVDGGRELRRREAAEWFTLLGRREVSVEDLEAFAAWRDDPANARVYREMEAVWDAAGGLAGDPDLQALTLEAHRRRSPRWSRALRESRSWAAAGVIGAALLLIASAGVWMLAQPETYATSLGERRTVRLADGSRVTLDTDSRIEVKLHRTSRKVTLASGQALFDVAPDPSRPFVVEAGDARVTALGTLFDIRLRDEGVEVTLVEGRVSVRQASTDASWVLNPGEQVATAAARPAVRRVDAERETSWTSGRLVFDNLTVAEAIAEANRYSDVKIRLQAPEIEGVPISGVFNAGDTEALAGALADRYGLAIRRAGEGQEIVLRPDRPAGR